MPFVQVFCDPDRLGDRITRSLVATLATEVAAVLTELAPAHVVTEKMVDVVVHPLGPFDRVNPDMLVTVLARHEDDREASADSIVARLNAVVQHNVGSQVSMVELVLTRRFSNFHYDPL